MQNDIALGVLLTEMNERLGQPGAIETELQAQFAVLQQILQTRALEAASQPIETWEQLGDRLLQIKHAYKQGLFDVRLETASTNLRDFLDRERPRDEPEYWKAHTLVYELNDIFHKDFRINDWSYNLGEKVLEELREESVKWDFSLEPTSRKRHLLREKVLFCTCRGNELKRRGDTNGSLKLFTWLYEFTSTKLVYEEKFPCYGTLANISYHLGSVYRILEQHDKAEAMYTQALTFYYERSRRRQGDVDDFFWVTRRIAMCIGLGFGWLNLTRGHLQRAENALATARSMLARIPNNVVTFYIELLYGTIKRCRAGRNQKELKDAIDSLGLALKSFEGRHARYAARACWELALAFNQLGDFEKADAYLNMMAEHEGQMNFKWQTNMHVLRSRIRRGQQNYQEALSEVESAFKLARECEEVLPRIDALITRGELYLEVAESTNETQVEYATARADFEQSLQLLQRQQQDTEEVGYSLNPKIAAVCELRIAQCWLREGNKSEGLLHFNEWTLLQPNVEHGWVRALARDVKSELDRRSEDFSISSNDPTKWKYSERIAELRNWLLKHAMRHSQNNWSEAAKLIGVERATLYQWRHGVKDSVKRARISERKKVARQTETSA